LARADVNPGSPRARRTAEHDCLHPVRTRPTRRVPDESPVAVPIADRILGHARRIRPPMHTPSARRATRYARTESRPVPRTASRASAGLAGNPRATPSPTDRLATTGRLATTPASVPAPRPRAAGPDARTRRGHRRRRPLPGRGSPGCPRLPRRAGRRPGPTTGVSVPTGFRVGGGLHGSVYGGLACQPGFRVSRSATPVVPSRRVALPRRLVRDVRRFSIGAPRPVGVHLLRFGHVSGFRAVSRT
jgi:hypothetical protein